MAEKKCSSSEARVQASQARIPEAVIGRSSIRVSLSSVGEKQFTVERSAAWTCPGPLSDGRASVVFRASAKSDSLEARPCENCRDREIPGFARIA